MSEIVKGYICIKETTKKNLLRNLKTIQGIKNRTIIIFNVLF